MSMETIGSGKTDKWVNVREKLGKMRNVSCWSKVTKKRLADFDKDKNYKVKDNERRMNTEYLSHTTKGLIEFSSLVNCIR